MAFGHARRQPSDENLHEWRKRLKDLLYQLRLLQAAWPTVLGAYVQEAHRLADLLGDDHDLTVLISVLRDSAGPATLLPTSADPLIELAAQRRANCRPKPGRWASASTANHPRPFAGASWASCKLPDLGPSGPTQCWNALLSRSRRAEPRTQRRSPRRAKF